MIDTVINSSIKAKNSIKKGSSIGKGEIPYHEED